MAVTNEHPHPKRHYTGFDGGRPSHVAALTMVKLARGKVRLMWGDEGVVILPTKDAARWIARAVVAAQEAQADRRAAHEARVADVAAYLAKRAARVDAQLTMF